MRRPIRQNPDTGGCGFSVASPRAYHHAKHLYISHPSGISFGPKPALLCLPHAPHRPVGLRRPIRRNPDRRGCGFSITSPRAYHHVEHLNVSHPSGISFGPKPALLSLPHAPHRPAGLRRPLRRNPDRGDCGFSVASPRAYHHTERLNVSGLHCHYHHQYWPQYLLVFLCLVLLVPGGRQQELYCMPVLLLAPLAPLDPLAPQSLLQMELPHRSHQHLGPPLLLLLPRFLPDVCLLILVPAEFLEHLHCHADPRLPLLLPPRLPIVVPAPRLTRCRLASATQPASGWRLPVELCRQHRSYAFPWPLFLLRFHPFSFSASRPSCPRVSSS